MLQVCQVRQVVYQGFPMALGSCDVSAAKMPCLPALEVCQPWPESLRYQE